MTGKLWELDDPQEHLFEGQTQSQVATFGLQHHPLEQAPERGPEPQEQLDPGHP